MLRGRSSSSQDEDQNFQNHDFKKIDYFGRDFSSENLDSINDDSMSESESKKATKLCKKNTSLRSVEPEEKSKAIKKNRESAKMSRLRKKQYQQKLEQRVLQLQNEISDRKANIKNISDKIFNKFRASNLDKHKYLTSKIQSSKYILNLMKQITVLRQPTTPDLRLSNQIIQHSEELVKTEYPSTFNQQQPQNASMELSKQQSIKGRYRKKKCEEKQSQSKTGTEERLTEREALLDISLKNYMYEFGMKGCLRTDVIERSKYEWLHILNSNAQPNQQMQGWVKLSCSGGSRMKSCMQRLDNKSKLLDFHLRELRDKIKDKYAIEFLLDRQFFINNSAETIYKNSQFKDAER